MTNFQDLRLNQAALRTQYVSYFNAGNLAAAFKIFADNPSLADTALDAANLNQIVSAINTLENNYATEVTNELTQNAQAQQSWIDEFRYVGNYVVGTRYKKFNFVTQGDNTLFFFADMTTDNALLYSITLTLKGETGASSLGVNYRGIWNQSTSYSQRDVVSYLNKLYVANAANIGVIPAGGSSWTLVVSVPDARISVASTAPSGLRNGALWIETK